MSGYVTNQRRKRTWKSERFDVTLHSGDPVLFWTTTSLRTSWFGIFGAFSGVRYWASDNDDALHPDFVLPNAFRLHAPLEIAGVIVPRYEPISCRSYFFEYSIEELCVGRSDIISTLKDMDWDVYVPHVRRMDFPRT